MHLKQLKQYLKYIILCFSLSANYVIAKELNQLQFYTEDFPPYNFKEKEQLRGIAVDVLVAASKKVNSPVTRESIKLQPWARAYRTNQNDANSVLFSTTRTEERENLFKWVGPIATSRLVVLAKKSSGIVINSTAELASHKIMAIRDDVGEQLLKGAGVPEKKIKLSASANSIVRKLRAGRVKLWVYEENVAKWFLKKNGENTADYEVVFVLKESEHYYTFNLNVDENLVNQLQKGVDLVKSTIAANGKTEYENIRAQYN